jgi:type I restriction enzyme S subunit
LGSEWKSSTLGEVIDLKRGYDLPKRLRNQGGVPLISSAGVSDFHSESKVAGPGVVTGRYGTIGKVFFSPVDFWPLNTTLYVKDFKGNDPKFIYYFLKTLHFEEFSDKAAVPGVNRNHLHMAEVRVPSSILEQKAIAHILGSLDDKIELNRRMNATLEGMAQALFKSWFVDFDPVIDNALAAGNPIPDELAARAEVRRQALANGTANREAAKPFPAAFQETESMGWIPEGWEVSTIGEEVDTVGGGTPSTKNPDFWDDGEYPWVTPKDFSLLQDKVLLSSSRYLTKAGLAKVSSGLLSIGTVLMSSRAPVGYLAITQIKTAINQGFIGMICNQRLPSEYVLQWANSRMDDIKQASSGSTFAEISKKAFRPFQVIVPDIGVLKIYIETTSTIYRRIADNVTTSSTLTKLRDTLLPKLISGELRVKDAETMVKEGVQMRTFFPNGRNGG